MLIKKIGNKRSDNVKGIMANDQILLDCLCEMMENIEKKTRYSTDIYQMSQLKSHRRVINKVLEQNLILD